MAKVAVIIVDVLEDEEVIGKYQGDSTLVIGARIEENILEKLLGEVMTIVGVSPALGVKRALLFRKK